MTSFLFISQIVLTIFIVILVLLQKSSGGGLINYSGSNESVFGAKGANGFLAKTTLLFGTLFLLNTIALSYAYTKKSQSSIMRDVPKSLESSTIPQAPKLQDKLNTLQPKKDS
ncbi:preprotein translocase subunit SecG [Helicobacter enhydrae]|uniref:Protein-export membrane protein SecG n=2 Tax=Helicobacter enhydrae TaxID=222136 RepID=A0A1B1U7N1_9HELI|nr:preprotein translocase subunit SecG [Helicobacter enhydrae]ANV98793.1 preprotein translocase subunit SecG [Helicobacter enhydrae]